MAKTQPLLAKLTGPRLLDALPRERLFLMLDSARERRRIVHVEGPPGSGKTTLLGSWLTARALPCLWYTVDAGDRDLASFFHYLGMASRRLGGSRRFAPPVLGAEYRGDVVGFARRFARALYGAIKGSAIIVLDDYQEAAPVLDHILPALVEEVPANCMLIISSRNAPSASLATAVMRGEVGNIVWEDLRLSFEEFSRLAGVQGRGDDQAARALYERSAGWPAAVRMLLDGGLWSTADAPEGRGDPQRATLLHYFQQHVLQDRGPQACGWLMQMAQLPYVTADMAFDLVGESSAFALLTEMYRRSLFVYRRAASSSALQFHPLLRELLLSLADTEVEEATRRGWLRAAGLACRRVGEVDSSFALLAQGGHWADATDLLTTCWEQMIRVGRDAVLLRWLEQLPADWLSRHPMLQIARGQALTPTDPMCALLAFERAAQGMQASGDTTGVARCAAGAIEAVFAQHANHARMDPWLPLLQDRVLPDSDRLAPDLSLRVHAALLIGLLYRAPGNRDINQVADRLAVLLGEPVNPVLRLSAATNLLIFCTFAGRFDLAAVALVHGDGVAGAEDVPAFARANWLLWSSYYWHLTGDGGRGIAAAKMAETLARTEGFAGVRFLATYFQALHCARMGDSDTARIHRDAVFTLCDWSRPLQSTLANACAAWLGVYACDVPTASVFGELSLRGAIELGWPSARIHYGIPRLFALVESGMLEDARDLLGSFQAVIQGTALTCFDCLLLAVQARIAEKAGDLSLARQLVARMWQEAARAEGRRFLSWVGPWMARWAAWGLEDTANVAIIAPLIRSFGWGPPPRNAEHWPWRVRIYTLGRFEIQIDDRPLVYGRKAPRKPLALFKLLIGHGNGGMSESAIMQHLWPMQDGDAAGRALDITLHRLRKWLGVPDVIRQSDGRLVLNTQLMWADVWALAAQCDEAAWTDEVEVIDVMHRIIRWYGGDYLREDEESWILPVRDTVRRRVVDAISRVAIQLEAGKKWDEAILLYQHGIVINPVAERLYLGLMRCFAARGSLADAQGAFRDMKQVLSIVLGAAPSPAAEQLRGQLLAKG